MAVPTQLSDLNVTIGSNPPAGTDSDGFAGADWTIICVRPMDCSHR